MSEVTSYRQRSEDQTEPDTDPYEAEEGDEFDAVPAADAAREGLRQIVALSGREPSGIVSVEPVDEGWVIGVELVEDRRVPASTDLLGLYEAELDPDGELLAYRRVRRYQRGKGEVG